MSLLLELMNHLRCFQKDPYVFHFLNTMKNTKPNRYEIILILIYQTLEKYNHLKRGNWQGALPIQFRNIFLELRNDRKNKFRSERMTRIVQTKQQYKMSNFLDVVHKNDQYSQDNYEMGIKREIVDELFEDVKYRAPSQDHIMYTTPLKNQVFNHKQRSEHSHDVVKYLNKFINLNISKQQNQSQLYKSENYSNENKINCPELIQISQNKLQDKQTNTSMDENSQIISKKKNSPIDPIKLISSNQYIILYNTKSGLNNYENQLSPFTTQMIPKLAQTTQRSEAQQFKLINQFKETKETKEIEQIEQKIKKLTQDIKEIGEFKIQSNSERIPLPYEKNQEILNLSLIEQQNFLISNRFVGKALKSMKKKQRDSIDSFSDMCLLIDKVK